MPLTVDPSLERLLADVDPKWHIDFVRFVQTGKADPEFFWICSMRTRPFNRLSSGQFSRMRANIREPYQKKRSEANVSGEGHQQGGY